MVEELRIENRHCIAYPVKSKIKLTLNMIQLVIILGIGYRFYELAAKNQRNKWLFGILSAILFFAMQFIFEFILAVILLGLAANQISAVAVALIGMGLALVITYVIYNRIKQKWEAENRLDEGEILDR